MVTPSRIFGLVLALVATSPVYAEELSLAQAEEKLVAAEGLPSSAEWGMVVLRWRIKELSGAFRNATAQHPARAHLGLGRCQMLLGQYHDAEQAFRKALRAAPSSPAASAELQKARQLARAADAIGPLLPKGQVVVQVAAMQEGGRKWWLAASARLGPKEPWLDADFYREARLRLFRGTRRGMEQVWRSEELRVRPGTSMWMNDLRLYALHESPPKVLLLEAASMADSTPSHINVFTWEAGKLVPVLALGSDEVPRVEDLNADGGHEIISFERIGDRVAISDMPWWPDIHAYQAGRYVLANQQFPKEFLQIGAEIQQRLAEHPDDYELLKYLGVYHEIEGDRKAALDAYRRAEAALTSQGTDSESAKSERDDIRARIQRLGR